MGTPLLQGKLEKVIITVFHDRCDDTAGRSPCLGLKKGKTQLFKYLAF